ncbi:DUF192 domain-containing protein [Shewanella eurypsychrophilus]|uniref:DUF192 domain-containing protein n=1 Tax=Shewanella eurypsychrophilus TaxID=2593656 RepID=A0ABX6VA84_9GAMM|nr:MULTISPECIES: DUF192 domain-containing protein [Shewanella]QFU24343.1 DUF192 domain-containing protein [Shewanella sp. YLB-09]QPG59543.1 DUF192 domain-containing protein [Shewanella eurypsychrophilus]
MKKTRLTNHNGNHIEQVFLANTPWLRLRGLLGRKRLTHEQGMLITPCNSVHTIGMKYPLDIVYLNNKNKVLKIKRNLQPWRSSTCRGATQVLELAAGNTNNKNINQGDTLSWQD